MLGAIVGDVLGSCYEAWPADTKGFQLCHPRARFTDDTVLSVAVASAILEQSTDGGWTPERFAHHLRDVGRRYPDAGYGGTFRRWLNDESMGPYNSWGNGSAMRVSPVGWAFGNAQTVLEAAERSAVPTHNHPEGVKGAQAVALAVFYARNGASKQEIRDEIEGRFGYDLSRWVDEIRHAYQFDVSCQGSVPEAIISFLDSTDFEDAVRTAISLGGDADTQACIAGAIAEAYYREVPDTLLAFVLPRLDGFLLSTVAAFAARYLPASSVEAIQQRLSAVGGMHLRCEFPQPTDPLLLGGVGAEDGAFRALLLRHRKDLAPEPASAMVDLLKRGGKTLRVTGELYRAKVRCVLS